MQEVLCPPTEVINNNFINFFSLRIDLLVINSVEFGLNLKCTVALYFHCDMHLCTLHSHALNACIGYFSSKAYIWFVKRIYSAGDEHNCI